MKKDKNKNISTKNYLLNETDKVGEIAVHYGFSVIKTPHITNDDVSKAKHFRGFDYEGDVEERVAMTRWYNEESMQTKPQPLFFHYKKPFIGSSKTKKSSEEIYGFEIMGSNKATSEALLIKMALAILHDFGYKDVYVDINTIGDKESISKFEKELNSYFKKHSNLLPAKNKQDFKKNIYSIVRDEKIETDDFRKCMPQTIGSLSEVGREYFKEILEFIEAFEVPYRIKSSLISNKLFASHTVFEIRQNNGKEDGLLLAKGYRYNYLAKKIGCKKEIPSVCMTIQVKKNPKISKKISISKIKKPKFYLVQLGETAKLKALNVVEHLRKSKIPVYHSIAKDKITGQLSGAEYMQATHVLIIGQKEAIENTIVVRNINTREQDTISIKTLIDHLKNFL